MDRRDQRGIPKREQEGYSSSLQILSIKLALFWPASHAPFPYRPPPRSPTLPRRSLHVSLTPSPSFVPSTHAPHPHRLAIAVCTVFASSLLSAIPWYSLPAAPLLNPFLPSLTLHSCLLGATLVVLIGSLVRKLCFMM